MLKEKYQSLLDFGANLKMKNIQMTEETGKLHIKGLAPYHSTRTAFWTKRRRSRTGTRKSPSISGSRRPTRTDSTLSSLGDTLSKLAKGHLGDAKRYMEIFNLNKDKLKDPDKIMAGQTIQLPAK